MVILLGLAAAVLYGTGDFLGGLATRRVQVLTVLLLAQAAGVIVALPAAAMWPGPASLTGLAWGIGAGLAGGPMTPGWPVGSPTRAAAGTAAPPCPHVS